MWSNYSEAANMSTQQAETVEFKVVHKRSSNQGRRQERPPHSNSRMQHSHSSHSDETSSTRKRTPLHHLPHKDKSEREVRLRPQTHRSSGSSTRGEGATRSSSSGGSSRDKEEHSYHHHHAHSRHRNSNSLDNDSSNKGSSKADKITSPNRFEKLEKLDPDVDMDNESSSSTKSSRSSADSDKKRSLSSHKSSKSGLHHRNKGLRDNDVNKNTSVNESHLDEVYSNGDMNRSSSVSTHYTSLESSELSIPSVSDLSKEDEPSVSSVKESQSELSTSQLTSSPGSDSSDKSNRISYTREELLALKSQPLSLCRPKQLDSCDICIPKVPAHYNLTPDNTLNVLLNDDDTESVPPDGGKVTKHPTALTLIREYGDNKHLGKVSLSPQRRSFHSGCSWTSTPGSTTNSNTSEAPPTTPPPTKNNYYSEKQHGDFEGSTHHSTAGQRSTSSHHGSNYQGPPTPSGRHHSNTSSHAPRVIDHIPLMDQEQQRHKKQSSWRERNRDNEWRRGSNQHYTSRDEEEPEPEWMEFGPTDRFDVIELKGMDEHEREREARKRPDSQSTPADTTTTSTESEELYSENPLKLTGTDDDKEITDNEQPEILKVDLSSPLEAEEPGRAVVDPQPQLKQVPRREEVDEYMLEGFDFSTGVRIFKELDLDEESDAKESALFGSSVETPSQLSNALMRALKVGGQEEKHTKLETRSRPANVLTLDEIQARENIQPLVSQSTEGHNDDLGAFNKLVAVLQSSGDIHEEKKPPPTQPQKPLAKPVAMATTYSPSQSTPAQSLHNESTGSNNNFGYLLEKELEFEERMMSPPSAPTREHPTTLISRGDPPSAASLSRLHRIEQMLENLDRSHAHTGPIPPTRGYGHLPPMAIPPPGPPHAGITSPMNVLPTSKRMTPTQPHPHRDQQPHPLDSDNGWMYPPADSIRQQTQPTDVYHHHPSNHRQLMNTNNRSYQMMSSGSSGRSNANNWAVEMERRRVLELQQMQLKERMLERDRLQQQQQQLHSVGHPPPQAKVGPSTRPNISLLPTSVMRHMHNSSKSTQPHVVDNMPKSSPSTHMANRLDQELTSKASQTHSAISSLLNHSTDASPSMDYPPPTISASAGRMRAPPPPHHGHAHHMMHHATDPTSPMMYQRYNMPTMPHGIPAQNPYMY